MNDAAAKDGRHGVLLLHTIIQSLFIQCGKMCHMTPYV